MPTYASLVLEVLQQSEGPHSLKHIEQYVSEQRAQNGQTKTNFAYVYTTISKLVRNGLVLECDENMFQIEDSQVPDTASPQKNKLSDYNIFTKQCLAELDDENENKMAVVSKKWKELKSDKDKFRQWKESLDGGAITLNLDIKNLSVVSDTLPQASRLLETENAVKPSINNATTFGPRTSVQVVSSAEVPVWAWKGVNILKEPLDESDISDFVLSANCELICTESFQKITLEKNTIACE